MLKRFHFCRILPVESFEISFLIGKKETPSIETPINTSIFINNDISIFIFSLQILTARFRWKKHFFDELAHHISQDIELNLIPVIV